MKKYFVLMMTMLFVLFAVEGLLAQEERGEYGNQDNRETDKGWAMMGQARIQRVPLCSEITRDLLKGIKTTKKRIKNGMVLTMMSTDPEALNRVREALGSCGQKMENQLQDYRKAKDLLSMRGVIMAVSQLEGGIQVQLTAEDKQLIDKIKTVKLTARRKGK